MTEATENTPERVPPAEHIDVRIGGKATTIFMSFGMRRALVAALGSMEHIDRILIDADLGDRLMAVALQERDKAGKITTPKELDDIEISLADADALLNWISEHLLDFFMKRLESTKAVGDKFGPMLLNLMASMTGSEASASPTASAGPSKKSRAK